MFRDGALEGHGSVRANGEPRRERLPCGGGPLYFLASRPPTSCLGSVSTLWNGVHGLSLKENLDFGESLESSAEKIGST